MCTFLSWKWKLTDYEIVICNSTNIQRLRWKDARLFKFRQFKFLKKIEWVTTKKVIHICQKKKSYVGPFNIFEPLFFFILQNIEYLFRYGLNKVKNIVIFSNFKITYKIFKILQQWKVDCRFQYDLHMFYNFSNLHYFLRYSVFNIF